MMKTTTSALSSHLDTFLTILFLTVLGLLTACGSKKDSGGNASIDGTYVYVDDISRSIVTISGDNWYMKTQFGAPGYYGSDAKYDSGKVKGKVLYYSGIFEYGKVSGSTLNIGGRRYRKQ